MQETIKTMVEKYGHTNYENFASLLNKCIVENSQTNSTYALYNNINFRIDIFYEGLEKLTNSVPKDRKVAFGVETLLLVFNELGLEIDKDDAFILFHLRKLGRFKIREQKLLEELKLAWKDHKDFELVGNDFQYSLKAMMRIGVIEYRKANLSVKQSTLIRYRNRV